jgi:predicted DNA binding CopG/RHH family protein
MSEKTVRYTKGDIGRVRVVEDFLPSPDELAGGDDNVKVTLSLTRRSLAYFKKEAARRHVPYQRMIRSLVDGYAERRNKKA